MAKKKYYVVKKGYKTGIFEDWATCSKQVHGYPGAIYKGFKSLELAKAYQDGREGRVEIEHKEYHKTEKEVMDDLGENEMIAYVDGSNLQDGSAFSWGVVAFTKDLGKIELKGMNDDPRFTKHRNVSGEIFAAVNAIKLAQETAVKSVLIYHDYSGIRHWALHEWKAKNKLAGDYQAFFQSASKSLDIDFVKVKGHDGIKFNEEADVLAKEALESYQIED